MDDLFWRCILIRTWKLLKNNHNQSFLSTLEKEVNFMGRASHPLLKSLLKENIFQPDYVANMLRWRRSNLLYVVSVPPNAYVSYYQTYPLPFSDFLFEYYPFVTSLCYVICIIPVIFFSKHRHTISLHTSVSKSTVWVFLIFASSWLITFSILCHSQFIIGCFTHKSESFYIIWPIHSFVFYVFV